MPPTNGQATPGDEIEIVVQNNAPAPVPEVLEDAAPAWDPSAPAAAPAGAAPQLFTVETVTAGVEALYGAVAERRGEHWRVSTEEAASIAEPLAGEVNDLAARMPFHDAVAGALGGRRSQLALAVAIVTGPRLYVDMQLAQQRAREARDAAISRREQPHPDTAPRPAQPPRSEASAMLADLPRPGAA